MTTDFLVTGAGGFLGRWTVSSLTRRGASVAAVISQGSSPPPELDGAKVIRCDLLDVAATHALIKDVRPACIVHFAWSATPGLYWTTPANWQWLIATEGLALKHFQSGGSRFVFASSCAEYDWARASVCVEHQTPTVLEDGVSSKPYSITKALARRAIEAMAPVHGATVATGRIFFQYGPHENAARLAPSVIRSLLANEQVETSHGRQVRDFLHAKDVGDAFAAIAMSDCSGPINIGSGTPTTLGEFICEIGRQIGRPELIKLGARPASSEEPQILRPDVTRLRDEVQWAPSLSLEEGVAETIQWWQSQQA